MIGTDTIFSTIIPSTGGVEKQFELEFTIPSSDVEHPIYDTLNPAASYSIYLKASNGEGTDNDMELMGNTAEISASYKPMYEKHVHYSKSEKKFYFCNGMLEDETIGDDSEISLMAPSFTDPAEIVSSSTSAEYAAIDPGFEDVTTNAEFEIATFLLLHRRGVLEDSFTTTTDSIIKPNLITQAYAKAYNNPVFSTDAQLDFSEDGITCNSVAFSIFISLYFIINHLSNIHTRF